MSEEKKLSQMLDEIFSDYILNTNSENPAAENFTFNQQPDQVSVYYSMPKEELKNLNNIDESSFLSKPVHIAEELRMPKGLIFTLSNLQHIPKDLHTAEALEYGETSVSHVVEPVPAIAPPIVPAPLNRMPEAVEQISVELKIAELKTEPVTEIVESQIKPAAKVEPEIIEYKTVDLKIEPTAAELAEPEIEVKAVEPEIFKLKTEPKAAGLIEPEIKVKAVNANLIEKGDAKNIKLKTEPKSAGVIFPDSVSSVIVIETFEIPNQFNPEAIYLAQSVNDRLDKLIEIYVKIIDLSKKRILNKNIFIAFKKDLEELIPVMEYIYEKLANQNLLIDKENIKFSDNYAMSVNMIKLKTNELLKDVIKLENTVNDGNLKNQLHQIEIILSTQANTLNNLI